MPFRLEIGNLKIADLLYVKTRPGNFKLSNFKLQMTVRPATSADVAAMRAIEERATTAAHWSETEYQRLFSAEPPRLAFVVGDDTVQGFLIARQIGPEWELENIAVVADAQRRGLGSALVRHFLDMVKQRAGESVFLEVRESNTAARALYREHGFVQTGRRRGYYQHPDEDAVLYRKALGTSNADLQAPV
jgi:ribosomal-protein-alanine N-acetyltransferase